MNFWIYQLPILIAAIGIASFGFFLGSRRKHAVVAEEHASQREFKRAKRIILELADISTNIRECLTTHDAQLANFRTKLESLGRRKDHFPWKELIDEAERMLPNTLRFSAELSNSFEAIRQQSAMLMSFTDVRTDPLTGLSNRRGLNETLANFFALMTRYNTIFSIVIFDVDHFKEVNDQHGHLHGDKVLEAIARTIEACVRETDVVARYGGEEFVVAMPETELIGASSVCERVRKRVQEAHGVTVSGGVACATDDDSPETLLARADAALYSSKRSGRNVVYLHDGELIVTIETFLCRQPVGSSMALAVTSPDDAGFVERRRR